EPEATAFSRTVSSPAASQIGVAATFGDLIGQPPSVLQVWLSSSRTKLPPSSSPTKPPSASIRKRSLQLALPFGFSESFFGPPAGPPVNSGVLQPAANSL